MKFGKWRVGVIALAVLVLVGSIAGAAVAAQNPAPASRGNAIDQDFVSKLATNLGISQSTLTAALKTTEEQMLTEAVGQGKITQAQADKIESSPNFGTSGFGFWGNPRGGNGFRGGPGGNPNDVAAALGISASQLKADMQAGQTIGQIVAAQGMTMQQFQQKMLTLKQQEISAAVAAGKLTQTQANQMIQRMEHHLSGTTSGSSGTTQS